MNTRAPGRARAAEAMLAVWLGLFAVLLYLPLVVMVLFSVNRARFAAFPFVGFSWRWYERLFADPSWIAALVNSLVVGVAASAIATVLGFLCGYALAVSRFRGKHAFTLLVLAPLAVPLILLGVSIRVVMFFLHLEPSLWFVLAGHVVYVLPLAVLTLRNRIARIPPSHEAAAFDLGATRWQAMVLIVLPQCRTALIATFLLTFTFAFDEFIVAYFLTTFELTLPIKIWVSLMTGFDPTVNAAGTLMLIASIALGVTAQALSMARERAPG